MAHDGIDQKIAEARTKAVELMPYMAHLVYSLVPVKTEQVPVAAVDQYGRLYYNNDVLQDKPLLYTAVVILHEALHLFCQHFNRYKLKCGSSYNACQHVWNVAADLAVNCIIQHINVELHNIDMLFPKQFQFENDLTAEEYYGLLATKSTIPDSLMTSGSCSDGISKSWEQGAIDLNHPGIDERTKEFINKAVAVAAKEHEKQHGVGTISGAFLRIVNELVTVNVDPFLEFSARVRKISAVGKGFGDFTYTRTSRRKPPGGFILPMHIKPIPCIAVVVDTSGSMDTEALSLALSLIAGILKKSMGSSGLTVLTGDVGQQYVGRVFNPENVQFIGDGGTDMCQLLNEALALKPRPQAIILVTDGDTPWPDEPLPVDLIVGLVNDHVETVPAWAKPVVLTKT